MSLVDFQTRAITSTPADRVIRNRIQRERAKQLWYLLACVVALLTIIRFARYVWSRWDKFPTVGQNPTKEKGDEEKDARRPVSSSTFQRAVAAFTTSFRITFFRLNVPIGPGSIASVSELTFILVYIAVMFVLLFVDTRDLWPIFYQDRAAHLASCQLPLVVALAGKNNIVSWLTGIGHEKLNVLHRAAARTNLIFLWIHALQRTISVLPPQFDFTHNWMRSGAVGLAAFTIGTIISIRPIRNAAFEFFLVTHIVLMFIFLVAGYYHARQLHYGTYIWPALLVWAFDRLLRLSRLLWNNRIFSRHHHGDALVELLSEDTIRLTLRRRHLTWKAGQHAYVILPSVSSMPFEAHPFTIASIAEDVNDNKERDAVFLIRGRSGFTERLRQHAKEKHGSRVPAFMDGPYGCPPDLRHYTTCILVAGGSGISYTLPLLLDLVRISAKGGKSAVGRVVFVWAVRDPAHLKWISQTLVEALNRSGSSIVIEPRIYITGPEYPIPQVPDLQQDAASVASSSEKKLDIVGADLPVYSSLKLVHGRPSMKKLIHDEIESSVGPISVDVAGPSSLAESIRRAVSCDLAGPASVLKGSQPVTLHVETFGMVKK
ncbi:unnamed protein product [Cyclocybe aegerita]|uniref:ferric-chelate reductase (NADPH) n=1 Tax=Cyclocybe aegerita TaxID=1973307 RepID=A0A8S0XLQ8_CYCAE|nr:unnamed protein product [Cyclocybe aegerita]